MHHHHAQEEDVGILVFFGLRTILELITEEGFYDPESPGGNKSHIMLASLMLGKTDIQRGVVEGGLTPFSQQIVRRKGSKKELRFPEFWRGIYIERDGYLCSMLAGHSWHASFSLERETMRKGSDSALWLLSPVL